MLPTPVQSSKQLQPSRGRRKLGAWLLGRTRITNLGVVLLAFLSLLSAFYNLRSFSSTPNAHPCIHGLFNTVAWSTPAKDLKHLIVVPGHGIWTGTDPDLRLQEDQWILESYQQGGGRLSAFFAHIEMGVESARRDEESLLVFSGGQTRGTAVTTEAESYLRLAISAGLIKTGQSVFARTTTENYALDSFQNLLFSVARFHEYTGRYPQKVTVVGYDFKRPRFTDLHRFAIRWPEAKFHYMGLALDDDHNGKAQEGELANGYLPYSSDLYGCHTFLRSKRRQRNPWHRFHSYYSSSPELVPLLDWCPGINNREGFRDTIFQGALPWDSYLIIAVVERQTDYFPCQLAKRSHDLRCGE